MSLEVSHVSYVYRNRYQSVQAVKDVSYAFAYGKLTALVGKSGSGKPHCFPCWRDWICLRKGKCFITARQRPNWIWTHTAVRMRR